MTKTELGRFRSKVETCLVEPFRGRVRDWCAAFLQFDEAGNHGPFRLIGCEYIGEVLDDFGDTSIADEVLVWGSQTRKTGTLMGGMAWSLCNDPCGALWVMPNRELAKKFSRQRWQKMLRASEPTKGLVPRGAQRHSFSTLEQILGASTINFVGSNSAANLASNPCRRVILDEVDKFNEGGGKEADAVNLAEQRTKDQPSPQRWKTSTPTIPQGLIWQEFQKGDQRRFFVPCPHCQKHVVLAWSKQFTTLRLTGNEAFVVWDKGAKSASGTWDLDRVKASAHAVCPHCGGMIRNDHKTAMLRAGEWRSTNSFAPVSFRSRQLSSLYSTAPDTTFGSLATKFLQAKTSLLGLQGFINGDLAEPYASQETIGERVELISAKFDPAEKDGWSDLMTVDCQARSPFFYWVHRRWKVGAGESVGVQCGSAETWEEVEDIQRGRGIPKEGVAIDSGWHAKSDAEVYARCAANCEFMEQAEGIPLGIGWIPTKGFPGRKHWREKGGEVMRPFFVRDVDPFEGSSKAGLVRVGLLGFSGDYFKDVLEALRKRQGSALWSVSQEMATEEYWRHMDGEMRTMERSAVTGRTMNRWVPRAAKDWPNHWFDCEVLQLVLANFLGLLTIEKPKQEVKP